MPPGIDGRETAKRIRALDPEINIVIVTGFSDFSPLEISKAAGPADKIFYIAKPFEVAEIQQTAAALVALHFLLVAPWSTRWTTKPLLALLLVATASATFYMDRYSVYLDPSMLRNVLRTDRQEARELLTPALFVHLAVYAGLPLLVLWRVRLAPRRSWTPSSRSAVAISAAASSRSSASRARRAAWRNGWPNSPSRRVRSPASRRD